MKNLFPILLFSLFVMYSCSDSSVELKASVSYNQNELVIKNGDDFDYNNARIELNEKYISKYNDIPSGQELRIPFSDLTTSDGDRFDLAKIKPLSLTIGTMLKDDKHGFVYLTWE